MSAHLGPANGGILGYPGNVCWLLLEIRMTWRSLSLIALLTPLTLVGCPPEDPSDSGDDSDGTEGTEDTGTEDTGTEGTEGTDAPDFDCHVLPSSLPDWAGDLADPTLVTNTPYTVDAGLGPVFTAAEAATDGAVTVDLDVTGAIVTTLDFNRDADESPPAIFRFWVADSNGAINMRLSFDAPGWDVVAGDEINFTATSVNNFNGTLQIDAIENLTVVSEDNPVHVIEANGIAIDTANNIGVVHHVFGEVVSAGEGCQDPTICFDFETRLGDDTNTSIMRIRNDRLQTPLIEGDCIEIQAPLSQFSGEAQFNIGNFQWHRWYGNIND